jgi:hypothetical protein
MRKSLVFLIFTFACFEGIAASDLQSPVSPSQQAPFTKLSTPLTPQTVIAPKSVVKTALDSLKGIINSKQEKGQEFGRMKNFSGCFLHPAIKQKAMMTLVLGGMRNYTLVKETLTSSGAKVEVDIQFDKEKARLIFELVYRKKAWWITQMN